MYSISLSVVNSVQYLYSVCREMIRLISSSDICSFIIIFIFLLLRFDFKKEGDVRSVLEPLSQPYGCGHPPILAQTYQIVSSQPLPFSNPKRGLTVCENDLSKDCLHNYLAYASTLANGLYSSFLFNLPCYCYLLGKIGFALCQFAFLVPLVVAIANLCAIKPNLHIAQT